MEIPAEIKATAIGRLSNKPPSSDVGTFSKQNRLLAKHNKCLEQTKDNTTRSEFCLLMFRLVHLKPHNTQNHVYNTPGLHKSVSK